MKASRRTVAWLVVNVHPQTTTFYTPFSMCNGARLAADGVQKGDVAQCCVCAQVAQAAEFFIMHDGDEVEAAGGVQIPFHVWEDYKVRGGK